MPAVHLEARLRKYGVQAVIFTKFRPMSYFLTRIPSLKYPMPLLAGLLFILLQAGSSAYAAQPATEHGTPQTSVSSILAKAKHTNGKLTYTNAVIFDLLTDTYDSLGDKTRHSLTETFDGSTLNASLHFINSRFAELDTFKNITFRRHISFKNCRIPIGLKFEGCRFLNGIEFENTNLGDLEFRNCCFETNTDSLDTYLWYFGPRGCYSFQEYGQDSIPGRRYFDGCTFKNGFYTAGIGGFDGEKSYSFFGCTFMAGRLPFYMYYKECSFMGLVGCRFNCNVVLANITIRRALSIYGTGFRNYVELRKVTFEQSTSTIEYDSLRHRITSYFYENGKPYLPDNPKALDTTLLYKDLMTTLYNLNALYKAHGDIESANALYTDLRDYETNLLEYRYQKQPSMQTYFEWKMNVFLKISCDYGTNPIYSFVYAFKTILLFALMYFLFPSEPDNLSAHRLLPAFEKLLARAGILKDGPPQDANLVQQVTDAQSLLQRTENHRHLMPPPLYRLARYFLQARVAWFRFRMRLHTPHPSPHTNRRSARIWTAYTIAYLLVFIGTGFFMRSLNAIALSLNAFVTLGYGELSAKGAARYLVVLEGAIGWFLLGIFSVSLISQILG